MATLVIFDIDGTLLNSAPVHQECFLAALEPFDFPKIDTDWDNYAHHTDSWTFGEVFFANRSRYPTLAELRTFDDRLHEEFSGRVDERGVGHIPGAVEFLKQLVDGDGYAIAFATGGLRRVTQEKMNLIDPDLTESLVATASEHTFREHIVLEAMSLAQAHSGAPSFDRVVSIGDGPWDAQTARTLRCEFIGIGPSAEHFRGMCPDANRVAAFDRIDLMQPYTFAAAGSQTIHDFVRPTTDCECWDGWSLTD